MLAKILALSIVVLAASPFTQPFSTVRLDRFHDLPTEHTWNVTANDSASIANVNSTTEPSNPPVEIRHAGHSERPPALMAAHQPGAHEFAVSAATHHPAHGAPDAESRTIYPFSVLRL
jgi:hypothetical protein